MFPTALAFAGTGWGDTIPFSLGPCPCCPVEVTACSLPTFRWPRRLVFTVTANGASGGCSNWPVGTTVDLVFCGSSTSGTDDFWYWKSTASLPGTCCTYLMFRVGYHHSGTFTIFGQAYNTNVDCGTSVDANCLVPGSAFLINCVDFDPDVFFPVIGSMGIRTINPSGDATCCPYAGSSLQGFFYSVDVP
jgi:hypothetical protein